MKQFFISMTLLFTFSISTLAQEGYQPSTENIKSREAFQDHKFGIFIHWGIYSMLAEGEWALHNKKINRDEYRKLASGFYPSKFNASKWVAEIKASGAKYICITSRHHDSFSMFGTKQSDYNIVDATPFKRDILKELAEACEAQGLRLHLYYSQLDWDRDDYYPVGRTGSFTGRTAKGDWSKYCDFMKNQLTELLTNYGSIGAIWFDGQWDKHVEDAKLWDLDEQYTLIHRLQPGCLVGNNHHLSPFPGEDFQLFERDLPGENKAGYSAEAVVSKLPLETCETMNRHWGYHITDQKYKTKEELIRYLVNAAGNNANLLMNIGPQPNGELPDTAVARLHEVGEWLKVYGSTIYGTRGGVVKPRPWGVTTQKGKTLYVHVLDLKDQVLFLPYSGNKLQKATVYIDQQKVSFKQNRDGIILTLSQLPTEIDYVLELTFKDEINPF